MRHWISTVFIGLAFLAGSTVALTQVAGHDFGSAAGVIGVVATADGELSHAVSHQGCPEGEIGHESKAYCGVSGWIVMNVPGAQSPVEFNNVRYPQIVFVPLGVNVGHELRPPRFG